MKKFLSSFIILTLILSMLSGFAIAVNADGGDYAWVLVDTYEYPIPVEENFSASLLGNSAEIQRAWPYGVGIYASRDYDNPTDMHAIYCELPGIYPLKQA